VGKSRNAGKTIGPNRDDRKQVNRNDRRKAREYLAEGEYEAVPSEQRLKKRRVNGLTE